MTDILQAYRSTRRSRDCVEFEIHRERELRDLLDAVNDRTLKLTAYTFIKPKPVPREIFACKKPNRITDHYVDIRLRPLIESELTDRTFNNRVGMGPDAAVNQVISDIYEMTEGFTKDAWIIKYDASGYFPNANRDRAWTILRDLVESKYEGSDKDDLLYLIHFSIFSDPVANCERRSPIWKWGMIPPDKSIFNKPAGIGGAIGRLIWQNTMNFYQNDIDHWLIDSPDRPTGQLSYNPEGLGQKNVRYVDDGTIITTNKEVTLSYTIPELRKRMAEAGVTMHPHKFYCQHYTKGVELLGWHIKMDRVYVNERIIRNVHKRIREFNRCPRPGKIDELLATLNSFLGRCKSCNGYAIARDTLDQLNPKWWNYVHFNPKRVILGANPGYTYRERIRAKYHLKTRTHDKRRKRRTHCAA